MRRGFLLAARRRAARWGSSAVVAVIAATAAAQDKDRHAGYYYPPPTVTETYEAEASTLRDSNRLRRIGFVTIIVAKSLSASYPPPYIMFVKGADAEKLIIIGMGDYLAGVYQARALLAQLTTQARTTDVFKEVDPEFKLTFLDLLKMLGFDQVTVSDGKHYSLQIQIK